MDPDVENVFGPVVYREEESIDNFTMLPVIIADYTKFEIKKFYNLTIKEFLSTTRYERLALINAAIDNMKKIEQELAIMKDQQKESMGDINDISGFE